MNSNEKARRPLLCGPGPTFVIMQSKPIAFRRSVNVGDRDRASGGLKCKSVLHLSPSRLTEGKGRRL